MDSLSVNSYNLSKVLEIINNIAYYMHTIATAGGYMHTITNAN
jgi:hypothetical protein